MQSSAKPTPFAPPTWIAQSVWQRWRLVFQAPGVGFRLGGAFSVLTNHFRPYLLAQRLERLVALGMIESAPSYWQVLVAAQHNMLGGAAVETKKFYEAQGIGFSEHNWRRFFCDPATMMDATGLFQSCDDIVRHVLQTFHRHPVYDFELLRMFEQGPEQLLTQLEQFAAGAHPLGHQFENLIEEPDYHSRLLDQARAFVANPDGVEPLPLNYPYQADPKLLMAMDQFTTLRGFLRYASRLEVDASGFWQTLTANGIALALGREPISLDPNACDAEVRQRYT